MLLYSRTGATALDDPEYGRFNRQDDGSFDLPDDLADRLLRFHHRGRPLWETEIDRGHRIASEDLEKRRDPANLLDAVQQILAAAQLARQATDQAASDVKAVKRGPRRSAPSEGDSE
jgi:MoxR-like ATPase